MTSVTSPDEWLQDGAFRDADGARVCAYDDVVLLRALKVSGGTAKMDSVPAGTIATVLFFTAGANPKADLECYVGEETFAFGVEEASHLRLHEKANEKWPLEAIDHVQLAIPAGGEDLARQFYGRLLRLREVSKPEALAKRGGCWFQQGDIKVHLGVEEPFRPNKKAHVAFRVSDVAGLAKRAEAAGYETKSDDDLEGYERVFIYDPFGNRLEFLRPLKD